MNLLEVVGLRVSFPSSRGMVRANDGIDLSIDENEIIGLIGETGCGKTILGRSMLRLLSPSAIMEGSIYYRGRDILSMGKKGLASLRGKEISMILQDPSASLNPMMRAVDQVAEAYHFHEGLDWKDARERATELLHSVGIERSRARDYPHQFSGGMRQRIMIAIGLALHPKILVADEPTKGLDEVNKKQVEDLLVTMVREMGTTLVLITHDIEAAGRLCDRIAVMYAGEIVEIGRPVKLLSSPIHPYTKDLLRALPSRGMVPTRGESPSLVDLPPGCRFHDRCLYASVRCREEHPPMVHLPGSWVRCHLFQEGKG
jgi:peptide/nickel transport system ATP-binding protein